jgi:hypothetical protein
MANDNELPKWVIMSQERLADIGSKIEVIKNEGQAEVHRGLEKVEEANKLQKEADYLGRVLSQPHDPQYWSDEIVTMSGVRLARSIESLGEDLDRMANIAQEGGGAANVYHARFAFALPSTDTSGGTAIYLGASIENRFLALEPSYQPVLSDLQPARITSRETLFQELKSAVKAFRKQYEAMVEGSETALHLETPDSLSQAAHSMRDCFQQLLDELAPSKVVETQPWFEATKGAPGGISRRSRLKYILYGSGENADEKTIQELDELSDFAKDALDLCMARAHDHDPTLTKAEVLLAIDQARNALLNVLKLYTNFRRK